MYVLEPKKEINPDLFSRFKERYTYKLDYKLYLLCLILLIVIFILILKILYFYLNNIFIILLFIFIIYFISNNITYIMDKNIINI